MKAKKILRNACTFLVALLVSAAAFAQQQKSVLPGSSSQEVMRSACSIACLNKQHHLRWIAGYDY